MAEEMTEELENLKKNLPDEDTAAELADLFKVFGDSTRTKILCVLHEKDLCVNDIAMLVNMSISAVSHQLRVLRNAKLVKTSKNGKEVIYSLDDDHVMKIIDCGLSHINE